MEQGVVRGETAGAVVALVQDGRLLVARGYGMADVANAVPVQARLTTFRVGSITKVLTWIAILQQVEAGKLDLDADIQTYLDDIQLPDNQQDRDMMAREMLIKFQMSPDHPMVTLNKAYRKF